MVSPRSAGDRTFWSSGSCQASLLSRFWNGIMKRSLLPALVALIVSLGWASDVIVPMPMAQAESSGFTFERFDALADAYEESVERRDRLSSDHQNFRQATREALTAAQELLDFLSGWIRSGTLPDEEVGAANEERLVLLQNIIVFNASLDNCDEASGSLRPLELLLDLNVPHQAEILELSQRNVDECRQRVATMVARPGTRPSSDDPAAPSAESGTSGAVITGWTLVGLGGASLIGGLVYDLTLSSDASTWRDCRNDPATCSLTNEERDDLRDRLQGAKAPIAILTFGGATLATVGTVLLLTQRGGRSAESESAAFRFEPTLNGFQVSGRF